MVDSKEQRVVIGYHGCDAAVAARVLDRRIRLKLSTNPFDWLGHGIYFWEHGPRRAYEWAMEQMQFSGVKVVQPAVLGARIDLGVCLDLLDTANTTTLGRLFAQFRRAIRDQGLPLPKNRAAP